MIDNTIEELDCGDADRVFAVLSVLNSKLYPTYETRADYGKLVALHVYPISVSPTLGERNEILDVMKIFRELTKIGRMKKSGMMTRMVCGVY